MLLVLWCVGTDAVNLLGMGIDEITVLELRHHGFQVVSGQWN